MERREIRAVGDLVGSAAGGFARFIQDTHEAIAGRPFEALGVAALPVRLIHDAAARSAYRVVGSALAGPPRAAGAIAARAASPVSAPMSRSLRGSMALGALNGAIGDVLSRDGNPLAITMTLRRRGEDISMTADDLATAYPEATGKLAVFVHGLCETDEAWHLLPIVRQPDHRGGYGSRLREDLGYTPLYLRYNTGLHISDNGRQLSALMEEVFQAWPRPVEEIVLVGHSMGGLVGRSACHYGQRDGSAWTGAVRHVFCLGSPHLGAPLEKAANVAGYALARLPETRGISRVVNGRSAGIKDLRFGSCAEEDWCDCDPDEFLRDRCCDVPFLESATYYFVGATIARSADGLSASLIGDLLVRFPSASGRGRARSLPFEIDNGMHAARLNHFQLLNHPVVYEQIRAWLERAAAQPRLPAAGRRPRASPLPRR